MQNYSGGYFFSKVEIAQDLCKPGKPNTSMERKLGTNFHPTSGGKLKIEGSLEGESSVL